MSILAQLMGRPEPGSGSGPGKAEKKPANAAITYRFDVKMDPTQTQVTRRSPRVPSPSTAVRSGTR